MRLLITTLALLLSTSAMAETKQKQCFAAETAVELQQGPKFPPLKTGFLIDLDPAGRDGFFYIGLEVTSFKVFGEEFSFDVGVASSRVMTGVGWGALYDGKVGPFVWGGYNIAAGALAYGIGFTVLKL